MGLLWKLYGSGHVRQPYLAPTWSWAGLDFIAESDLYDSQVEIDESKYKAEILVCEIIPMEGNSFGYIISGRLKLRSLWLDLEQWKSKRDALIQVDRFDTYLGLERGPVELQNEDSVLENQPLTPEDPLSGGLQALNMQVEEKPS
ncbi:hypothetical protein BDZ45DRAFT_693171 [Acephala macrosclerotiorum]|nr:hypothetical protein BDZ45DRAFT_693171 [Acephala macrosclerotiorum]